MVIFLRRIKRNFGSYAVASISLFLGVSSSLCLFLLSVYELNFDHFHTHSDRIYRISTEVTIEGGSERLATSPRILGEAVYQEIPEVEDYTRILSSDRGYFEYQGIKVPEKEILLVESNFFDFFDFNQYDSLSQVLDNPGSIVLTEALADRIFGRSDVVGEQVSFNGNSSLLVSSVLPNVPDNSHLKFNALISYHTFYLPDAWDELDVYTYVMVNKESSKANLTEKLERLSNSVSANAISEYDATIDLIPVLLPEIHYTQGLSEELTPSISAGYLYIISSIAVFFLFIGTCSYVNINMAATMKRMKDIGVKRILGANNKDISIQVALEFVIFSSVVLLIAIGLIAIILPFLSRFAERELHWSMLIDQKMILMYLAIITLGGVVSSLYPIITVFSYKPLDMLKNKISSGGKLSLMQIMVLVQFIASVSMILILVSTNSQINYISSTEQGLKNENILSIEIPGKERQKVGVFMDALEKENDIGIVSLTDFAFAEKDIKNIFSLNQNGRVFDKIIDSYFVDENFLQVFDLDLSAGRNFSSELPSDQYQAVLVNETLVKKMGWTNPLEENIAGPIDIGAVDQRSAKVIGVVKDFHINSVRFPIESLVLIPCQDNKWYRNVYVELNSTEAGVLGRVNQIYDQYFQTSPFQYSFLDVAYKNLHRREYKLVNILLVGTFLVFLITAIGIFGLSSLLSSKMEKEMAIRKILGGSTKSIFILYSSRFFRILLFAIIVAIPLSVYLINLWLQDYAHRASFAWHHSLISIVGTFLLILMTISYHAYKVGVINPVSFLRDE